MAEVFLWATAGAFALVGYGIAQRLGLHDEVPRDPKARVASYSSAVMLVVKDQLISCRLESCSAERVDYTKNKVSGSLWVENGALHCRHGKEQGAFPLGDLGRVRFSQLGLEISVEILAAETDGAEHSAHISIRVGKAHQPHLTGPERVNSPSRGR